MPYIQHLGRHAPDYGLVAEAVERCLVENAILEPPIQLQELVDNAGLQIFLADFPETLSQVMGFYDPNSRRIVANRADTPNRVRFTVAHEFGHHVLHRDFIDNHPEEYKVLLRQPMGGAKDPIEQEANSFAANLLVPRRFLTRFSKIASISELSRLFFVSEEVIRWRIQNEHLESA